ncbi:hypothetical protein B0H19DRAFT_1272611 [Mycena capillaripes]|nr:hypothetical protein B0H19DRAFT_1272399 [Mycena capillaripes]KAJ6533220.1 hypothetical protein B0H19DRAFT_1272611 [Mycena capillaripes]
MQLFAVTPLFMAVLSTLVASVAASPLDKRDDCCDPDFFFPCNGACQLTCVDPESEVSTSSARSHASKIAWPHAVPEWSDLLMSWRLQESESLD